MKRLEFLAEFESTTKFNSQTLKKKQIRAIQFKPCANWLKCLRDQIISVHTLLTEKLRTNLIFRFFSQNTPGISAESGNVHLRHLKQSRLVAKTDLHALFISCRMLVQQNESEQAYPVGQCRLLSLNFRIIAAMVIWLIFPI